MTGSISAQEIVTDKAEVITCLPILTSKVDEETVAIEAEVIICLSMSSKRQPSLKMKAGKTKRARISAAGKQETAHESLIYMSSSELEIRRKELELELREKESWYYNKKVMNLNRKH